jgi:hypothetical protein
VAGQSRISAATNPPRARAPWKSGCRTADGRHRFGGLRHGPAQAALPLGWSAGAHRSHPGTRAFTPVPDPPRQASIGLPVQTSPTSRALICSARYFE